MREMVLFTLLLPFLFGVIIRAQGAPQGTTKLTGKIVDPTGAAMADVDVLLTAGVGPAASVIASGKTSSQGDFELNVITGTYQLVVKVPDFKEVRQAIRVTEDMPPLSLTMSLALSTTVEVNSDNEELSVDPNSSLNTDVITGDALLELPDNEDDLLAYLTQLARQKGGDGDVTLSVDGFTGGNLPPLAQIAEIRIVNSSFTADGSNGPRIEIVTKAGSGKWAATMNASFNDESLNAANHLTTGKRPKSQNRNLSISSSGPLIPGKLSLNSTVSTRSTENGGSDLRAVTPGGLVSNGITSLTGGRTISLQPRLQLNKTHNITGSFQYQTTNSENSGVGGLTLPERAANNENRSWQLQLSDRMTRGKVVDTLRFQAQNNLAQNVPVTASGFTTNVTGAFNGGAAPNQTHSLTENFTLSNTMQWQASPKLAFSAIAFELQYHRSASNNKNNYNGTYTFASLYDYCAMLTPAFSGSQCQIELQKRIELQTIAEANGQFLDITPQSPTTFTQTSGPSEIKVSQAELALWVQGDWRLSPKANVSFGLRYQIQQHFKDYNNLAPVAGLSYQLRSKGNWKTIVRAGVKMTDGVFSMASYQQFRQSGFTSGQRSVTIQSPGYPDPTLSGTVSPSNISTISTRILAKDAVQPYGVNSTFAWEQSMPKGMTVSVNYSISRGFRQNRNININAPWPGTALPEDLFDALNSRDPAKKSAARAILDTMRPFFPLSTGTILETQSVGKSLTNTVSLSYRVNNYSFMGNRFRISASMTYTAVRGKDDSQFQNVYDRMADYARNSATGSRLSGTLTLNIPKRVTLALSSLGWNSGRPYSITTGTDLNGDSANLDRLEGFARNGATGPGNFALPSVRLTRIFVLSVPRPTASPSITKLVASFAEPEPQRGSAVGGFVGGGSNGGNASGNPNRTPPGARTATFAITATNIFNSSVRTNISGVLSSPLFGQVTGGSPGRKVQLGLSMKLF